MKTLIVGGLAILTVLSMMPAAAPLPLPVGITAIGANFVPAVYVAPSGSVVHFQSMETALHHTVLTTPGNAFVGHLMPTAGWTCVPGSNGFTLGGSTCFDYTVAAPAGSVILYHCQLHPFMNGAIVVV